MSYFRPHVFGVEAVSEVEALVTAFQCDVQDDQVDGMGTGPFTREGFVRGWNAGNRFEYSVFPRAANRLPGLRTLWRQRRGRV